MKDIIIQEYVNHTTLRDPRTGNRPLPEQIPRQSDLIAVQQTTNLSASEINAFHNYGNFNLIIGNPAKLAQAIRKATTTALLLI